MLHPWQVKNRTTAPLPKGKLKAAAQPNEVRSVLPKKQRVATPVVSIEKNSSATLLTEYKPRVLLIEDDPIAQFVQKRMLMQLNCQVDIASSAKQALEKAGNFYDVILLDIGLPDIHGTEVAMTINRMSKGHKQTRMIAVTAHKEDSLKRECLAVGVETMVYKPVEISDLRNIIFSNISH